MFDTQVGLVVAVRGVACFLKTCKQKNTKWFFLGSLLLLIGVVCFEKKSGKKLEYVSVGWFGLVWLGLVWFGLVALGCWLVEKMLRKMAKWLFLGSLLLLIAVVCFEKKVRKKNNLEYVSVGWFGLVWLGLAWFGLVWLLWVVGWLKKCWGK